MSNLEDILGMIGGASASAEGGALPPQVSPPPGATGQTQSMGGGDTVSILRQMIDLAKSYMEAESDEEDIATMTKVLQTLQQYLADEQAERDDAMQGKFSPKAMRAAYGG